MFRIVYSQRRQHPHPRAPVPPPLQSSQRSAREVAGASTAVPAFTARVAVDAVNQEHNGQMGVCFMEGRTQQMARGGNLCP